jgi:hypothetical protein
VTAQQAIHHLLGQLSDRLEEWRAYRDANTIEQAPEFTFFDFCDTSELGLSSIIAWMLDPSEDHGQGPAFLEAFIATFGIAMPEAVDLARARVSVEAVTDQIKSARRRIDIVITLGSFHVGIENKPYAGFQPRQIVDYCDDLGRRSNGQFALVVLKGWAGQSPEGQLRAQDEHHSRVVDSDYGTLQQWVRRSSALTKAPNVRHFLEQFDRFIEEEFVTGMSTKEEQIIVETVSVDERQLLAALDLIAAAPSLYEQLHRNVVAAVIARANKKWSVSDSHNGRERKVETGKYFLTIDFDPSWPVVFAFDLYSYGHHANCAIRERVVERPPARQLRRIELALQSALPKFERPGKSWLWWSPATTLDERGLIELGDPNIWKAAADPQALAGEIIKIAEVLETAIRSALAQA